MGALHEGHLSLIRVAAQRHEEVLVSVFVNPTQFGPNEDFTRYPRDLPRDAALAIGAGASIVFSPAAAEMYPEGEEVRVIVPRLSEGLCGMWRPGHFEGVATVVTKFFNLIGEGSYYFGKKDYQQWRVIEALARDLLFPIQVVGLPTVREADGLAMSSRNAFLTAEERKLALSVPRALQVAIDLYRSGERSVAEYERAMRQCFGRPEITIEYAELRKAGDLSAVVELNPGEPVVAAIAVRLGRTRLIDNTVLGPDLCDIFYAPREG